MEDFHLEKAKVKKIIKIIPKIGGGGVLPANEESGPFGYVVSTG